MIGIAGHRKTVDLFPPTRPPVLVPSRASDGCSQATVLPGLPLRARARFDLART